MTDNVEVTPEDREAAARWAKMQSRHMQAANILRGSCDTAPLVQAFARHRLAATASNAAMVEAYHHHLSEVCAECYAGEGTDAFLAAMEFLSKRNMELMQEIDARAKASEVQP
jgi:nitrogenase molybdenum-iron protein alpha/beta subunit